jgi:hypothetical protein
MVDADMEKIFVKKIGKADGIDDYRNGGDGEFVSLDEIFAIANLYNNLDKSELFYGLKDIIYQSL